MRYCSCEGVRGEGGAMSEGCEGSGERQGFIQDFFARGEIIFYIFLNMYSLLCFPLVWLLSFIWQWFSKCKK